MSKSPHDYFIHNALFYGWEESYIIYFMTEKMTADELLNYANTESHIHQYILLCFMDI